MNIRSKKIRQNNRGNMIINVLVSFAIFALLATVSLPFLSKYQPSLQLNAVARDLTSDLRYAQQLTISEQTVYTLTMSTTTPNNYYIQKTGAATTTVKTVNLTSGITFESISGLTNDTVAFNSYGGVSESGQIILKNSNNKQSIINIKPSGYVQLEY